MADEKRRLDLALVERGLVPTRARAQGAIKAGHVRVGGRSAVKPADLVGPGDEIELVGLEHPYVSRAALKLVQALDRFGLDPAGRACLDLGASTGGFTQVLLQRGAASVVAIDVGHGQLAEEIASDTRVRAIEGLNARDLTREHIPGPIDFIVADLSFIGLTKALPPALELAERGACLVALIKPQFEVGPENVGKGGIVRDPALHERVTADIAGWLEKEMGWRVIGIVESPIQGGDGNREFLIAACHDR
ncbi:TlyA family RNA methyltransferase [Parvibaculum sp.]|uniref:TlyA family RNA methyltransferase n=1 Tax=Parvibaculum sp. TaxID=2024848 RepID=UPI002731C4BF|nr:TlyA family RNA methyltransferase [Parvibaculum sp.]MDP1626847.1 TlyA family RNA methyltransferase [Parvibaculum sp.]MDP2148493.1 TlyA family RNA methyltransferase [Parvibaculum sp.]MDP3327816.1 TlyA family RNA methyltransferase [Parvibaculum sp.]